MKVLRKLENITSITIKGERNQPQAKALEEGKKILKKKDKHITSAEKYGWQAVTCYIRELLASNSDDEKEIN